MPDLRGISQSMSCSKHRDKLSTLLTESTNIMSVPAVLIKTRVSQMIQPSIGVLGPDAPCLTLRNSAGPGETIPAFVVLGTNCDFVAYCHCAIETCEVPNCADTCIPARMAARGVLKKKTQKKTRITSSAEGCSPPYTPRSRPTEPARARAPAPGFKFRGKRGREHFAVCI